MQSRRGFTLIELLVVIAIIAILAAILFPVFAQAKNAAKHATTVSNMKQTALAFSMYAGDYDDVMPVRATWNGNGEAWGYGACNVESWGCPTWDKVIYPYTKNYQLFDSSVDRTGKVPSNIGEIKRSYRAAKYSVRGLAGMPLSWFGSSIVKTPFSMTSFPAPADTILLTEQRNGAAISGTWWIWSTFWENWAWWTGSENTIANTDTPMAANDPEKYYSGIDFSNANKAAYAYVDGHVASRAKNFAFPDHQKRLNAGQPIDNTLKGVCIDSDDWTASTTNDCRLPGS